MARHEVDLALHALGLGASSELAHSVARAALARHGDLSLGLERLRPLSRLVAAEVELDLDMPTCKLSAVEDPSELEAALRALGPWKKGPFRLLPPAQPALVIDAEWRSDLKWQRVLELGVEFAGKRVLDVGTGNGYFLFRLQGAGALLAVGLEPGLRSVLQFLALSPLFPARGRALWPLRLEELPSDSERYDLVMSMGVLYHQRDPLEHLRRLRDLVVPGGELVLETLTIPGTESLGIAPGERYAGMRNVYVIPSQRTLLSWLKEADFDQVELGRSVVTTSLEQRRTAWAPGPSLEDVLAAGAGPPDDPARPTREGHPRPMRVALSAVRRPRP